MGHNLLRNLPTSRKWRDVVALLEGPADVHEIAAAAGRAADGALKNASDDPVLDEATWLMAALPFVARGDGFEERLEQIGLRRDALSDLFSLSAAISERLDTRAFETGGRTDLGEMAQASLVESLIDAIEPQLPSLFAPEPAECRKALGRLSSGDRFAALARDFFARLSHRALDHYLSRELTNHVGRDRRFATDQQRRAFDEAIAQHCREASLIVEDFAGDWYGKHVWRGEGLDRDAARGFIDHGFRKLRSELKRRQDAG